MKRFKTADEFIEAETQWQPELVKLRSVLCSTGLEETVKWGAPCYTHNGKNIVGLGSFKSYCGLWFFQGALLADEEGVLMNAQEGKTKAMRQWRFESKKDIKVRLIKQYVREAVALSEQGKEIKPVRAKAIDVPPELAAALKKNRAAQSSFNKLTPGRQREYSEYIAAAKRDDTKAKRIEKVLPMIRDGIGLNDRYR